MVVGHPEVVRIFVLLKNMKQSEHLLLFSALCNLSIIGIYEYTYQ